MGDLYEQLGPPCDEPPPPSGPPATPLPPPLPAPLPLPQQPEAQPPSKTQPPSVIQSSASRRGQKLSGERGRKTRLDVVEKQKNKQDRRKMYKKMGQTAHFRRQKLQYIYLMYGSKTNRKQGSKNAAGDGREDEGASSLFIMVILNFRILSILSLRIQEIIDRSPVATLADLGETISSASEWLHEEKAKAKKLIRKIVGAEAVWTTLHGLINLVQAHQRKNTY